MLLRSWPDTLSLLVNCFSVASCLVFTSRTMFATPSIYFLFPCYFLIVGDALERKDLNELDVEQ